MIKGHTFSNWLKVLEAAFVDNMGEVYEITKELVNTNTKAYPPVLDLNGNILSTDEDKLNRCREHFQFELVSSEVPPFAPPTETISPARSIPQTLTSKSEIVSAIKSLRSGKAAGIDGIPAVLYKSNPYMAAEVRIRRSLVERSVCRGMDRWYHCENSKKDNLNICDNWRGICVLLAISKIIAKVILDRIKDHPYSTIDREQAGFRPGSSCVDHINTQRIIIEKSAECRSDLHLIFVDFEKAFDSVDGAVLWMVQRRRNKIVSVIKSTYNGAK